MLAKAVGDDPGDGVGGSPRSASSDDGDGARWLGLGMDAGGSEHSGPGGKNLATLHGFLLLWPGWVRPPPRRPPSWQAKGGARRGRVTEISSATPLK